MYSLVHCGVLQLILFCFSPSTKESYDSDTTCPAMSMYLVCFPRTSYNMSSKQKCAFQIKPDEDDNEAGRKLKINQEVDNSTTITMFCDGQKKRWLNKAIQQKCFLLDEEETASMEGKNFSEIEEQTKNISIFKNNVEAADQEIFNVLLNIATVGHGVSILALFVAITLFVFMRRLLCMRVVIHINLMIAFFLRGLTWMLHHPMIQNASNYYESQAKQETADIVTQQYYEKDYAKLKKLYDENCQPDEIFNHKTLVCRIYYILLQYFSMANYYWLLVEGIYLLLLLKSFSNNKRRCMAAFIFLGWVFPGIVMACHFVLRTNANHIDCHITVDGKFDRTIWWVIKGPVLLSLSVNFVIYIMVLRIVASKLHFNRLNSRLSNSNRSKWRLAKSTLSLIPLLGIQYLVTGFVGYWNTHSKIFKTVKYIEIILTSTQGLFVAVIYCFCNEEIQEECKKYLRSWKLRRDLRRMSGTQNTSKFIITASRNETNLTVESSIRDKADDINMNMVSTTTKYDDDREANPASKKPLLTETSQVS